MHRSKSTDVDLGVGLVFSLWSCPKEIIKKVNAGFLITSRERNTWDWENRDPDHRIDKLGVNQNCLASDHSLHDQSSVIILDEDHVAIKFQYQFGKGRAGTIVQILLVVLHKHLSDGKQHWISQICMEKIPLW